MAPVITPAISRRADEGDDNTLGPIYILGIALACAILVGVVAWLGWRRWKKGSAFEPDMISEKEGNGLILGPRYISIESELDGAVLLTDWDIFLDHSCPTRSTALR